MALQKRRSKKYEATEQKVKKERKALATIHPMPKPTRSMVSTKSRRQRPLRYGEDPVAYTDQMRDEALAALNRPTAAVNHITAHHHQSCFIIEVLHHEARTNNSQTMHFVFDHQISPITGLLCCSRWHRSRYVQHQCRTRSSLAFLI